MFGFKHASSVSHLLGDGTIVENDAGMIDLDDKKNKKWVLKRHTRVRNILNFFMRKWLMKKYGFTPVDFEDIKNRNYLILYNHQTGWDQFLLGMSFKKAIYYVATEDIFSIRFVSPIIKYLVNPIPIKKSMTDTRAVMNCIKCAKEGGSIAIAPEGNRTFSGKTENMKESISKLVKALKLPIAFYIFEGGYGVLPRWADDVRTGEMKGYVKNTLEYDDYKDLSNEELYELIKKNLYQNDNDINTEKISELIYYSL